MAELDGKEVRFRSYWKPGTFGLKSDAVQALKREGLYMVRSDWERVRVDGNITEW